ncbi:MAG: zf-HC2 domain-containing protein [Myxococcota bacterium]|nr:zf-HC2 domain-containing protein [Myxococcota bacterium]
MNCWRVQNLLAPYLDEALPEVERGAFDEHLLDCDDCNQLVAEVAALPSFGQPDFPREDEKRILDALSASIHDRIAASAPIMEGEGQDHWDIPSEGTVTRLRTGEMRVSVAAAVAYVGVVLLLAGGIALNHQRVLELEASVQERDAIIDGMSARLAAAAPEDLPLLPLTSPSDVGVVIMPAGSTTTAGFGPGVGPLGGSGLSRDPGVSPRTVSNGLPYDSPRVLH